MKLESLKNYETPIIRSNYFIGNNNLFYKREDLLPFSLGGNKVRIALTYLDDMFKKGCDMIIGYGGVRSNLCRVIANMCSVVNVKCCIIYCIESNDAVKDTYNELITSSCGADIVTCERANVPEVIESTIEKYVHQGFKPYYIYGDKYGKGNESTPVQAYVDVYDEISKFEASNGKKFEYIFIASSTGVTQSGLICGNILNDDSYKKIIGISTARKSSQAEAIIGDNVKNYMDTINLKIDDKSINVIILDDWLLGGYGKYDSSVVGLVRDVINIDGVFLDPVYSGKAFYGMTEYLRKNRICDKNILFVHTGGIVGFFDEIKNIFN